MPTEIWHWLRSVPEEEKDEEEKATLIKSRDPHMAGREQQVSHVHSRDPSPTLLAAATSSMDQPIDVLFKEKADQSAAGQDLQLPSHCHKSKS